MKIIALAAAKGGVGKSTLAATLSTAAIIDRPGIRVGLVDLDPQGSLTLWWNARALPYPLMFSMAPGALAHAQDILRDERLDLLVLDCPPGFTSIQERAIAAADLVLVPTGPSKLDLDAVAATAAMAERAGVPSSFVLNGALFRSRLAGQAVMALRERGDLLYPPMHRRVAIAAAMADGRTALETAPTGAAAREAQALWAAVQWELETGEGQ